MLQIHFSSSQSSWGSSDLRLQEQSLWFQKTEQQWSSLLLLYLLGMVHSVIPSTGCSQQLSKRVVCKQQHAPVLQLSVIAPLCWCLLVAVSSLAAVGPLIIANGCGVLLGDILYKGCIVALHHVTAWHIVVEFIVCLSCMLSVAVLCVGTCTEQTPQTILGNCHQTA